MNRLYLFTVVLAVCTAVGCSNGDDANHGKDVVKREGHPDFIKTYDEALMERAMQKARATQNQFIEALQEKRPTTKGLAIKKPFGVGKEGEHIWLNEVSWDGKIFSAAVANEPVNVKDLHLGDQVLVTPAELSDWMYIEDGVLKGGYTIRVLHFQSTPEEQKEMLKHVPFSIPPLDF